MPSLQMLFWVALILLGVALLVSCSTVRFSTPTPAYSPHPVVTLTTVRFSTLTPPQHGTPPPILSPYYTQNAPNYPGYYLTLTRLSDWQNAPSFDLPLKIDPLTCYELPQSQVVCLGRIQNPTPLAWVDISVSVQVQRGELVSSVMVQGEQQTIQPFGFMPYRVQLTAPIEYNALTATLLTARPSEAVPLPLRLIQERGEFVPSETGYGYYLFQALVLNPTNQSVVRPRVIVTLLDEHERVVTYRVLELAETLAPHAQIVVQTTLYPTIISERLWHVATVETLAR